MSPAAKTSGSLVARRSSTSTPLSTSSPASAARVDVRRRAHGDDHDIRGDRLTALQLHARHPAVLARRCARPARSFAERRRSPRAVARTPARARRRSRPPAGSRRGRGSVTSLPRVRAVAPTSMPIQPEPISTTRRPPSRKSACERSESSTVRRVCTPSSSVPGIGRLRGVGSGGEQQPVVRRGGPVVERDLVRRTIDVGRSDAELQLDVVLRVPAGRVRRRCSRGSRIPTGTPWKAGDGCRDGDVRRRSAEPLRQTPACGVRSRPKLRQARRRRSRIDQLIVRVPSGIAPGRRIGAEFAEEGRRDRRGADRPRAAQPTCTGAPPR